jgi:hypothetical protein
MCATAFAEANWVSRFLDRYSPPKPMDFRRTISEPGGSLAAMMQNGVVSVTTGDIIRLLLANNRDLIVNRAVPISSLYSIESLFRPFEPTLHVIGAVSRATTPSANVLAGAVSLTELIYNYRVGIDHTLQSGTTYTVDFEFSRSTTNSIFEVYNPAYNGTISY